MKSIKIIAAIFILSSLTMSFINVEDWYQYETKYYKILFPKKPTESSQTVKSAIGDLKLNLSIYGVPENETEDNLAYLVNETEYPDSIMNSDKKDKLENFFRNSIDGAVNNVHGKLLSEKKIELNNFQGREIRADFQEGQAIITMRLYLVRNRLLLIETVTETKKDFNKSISRFMDSFKLVN